MGRTGQEGRCSGWLAKCALYRSMSAGCRIRLVKVGVAQDVVAVAVRVEDDQGKIRDLPHDGLQILVAVDRVDDGRALLAAHHVADGFARVVNAGDLRGQGMQNRSALHGRIHLRLSRFPPVYARRLRLCKGRSEPLLRRAGTVTTAPSTWRLRILFFALRFSTVSNTMERS